MMEFEDGSTSNFSMVATTKDLCIRKTRIFGSKGELDIDGDIIKHFDFNSQKYQIINLENNNIKTELIGHGYADFHTMDSFVKSLYNSDDENKISTGPDESLNSHLIVFAAEESRLTGKIVDL